MGLDKSEKDESSTNNDQEALALRIEEALKKAVDGRDECRIEFYRQVLGAKVFIPIAEVSRARTIPIIGSDSLQSMGYVLVPYEGRKTLPCFTRYELLAEWAEAEQPLAVTKEFSAILSLLNEETWVHLNPGQMCGKEFTPWEIGLLRSGESAIPDLVQDLHEGDLPDLEVVQAGEDYNELRRRLRILFEVYDEVEEAFLVELLEKEGGRPKPLLGLILAQEDEERLKQLQIEIDMSSRNSLEDYREVLIIHDLENRDSPNWRLLEGVNPFYIRQLTTDEVNSSFRRAPGAVDDSSIFDRVAEKFAKWRGRREQDSKKPEKQGEGE